MASLRSLAMEQKCEQHLTPAVPGPQTLRDIDSP
jgi:hypothetical protein